MYSMCIVLLTSFQSGDGLRDLWAFSRAVEYGHCYQVLGEGSQPINVDGGVLQWEGDREGEGGCGWGTGRQVDVVTSQRLLFLAGNLKGQDIGS